MPLHKSSRAPRLDPTMISAPLGDFRHTMHIGRGGDAFGDTSFLSTLGPGSAGTDPGSTGVAPATEPEASVNHSELQNSELQHSESVSSFTMDLDLDLGPSMLGDVLGPENRAEPEFAGYKVDTPPSPSSSQGSEYEGVTPLDRRRVNSCHSDSDSENDEDAGRGYTFEDEFDDEIGL
uniref:CDC42 effector protein (Rho GTPase binding) 5 n=1 Tax=Amphiprion percula TaxID=161767 RepID=A0A3P8SHK1_AMPPE